MPRIICSGETMALFTAAPAIRLRHAAQMEVRVGGAESNVAIALARLGIDTGWAGCVGADELGELVLQRIRAESVDLSQVHHDEHAPTGLYLRESVAGEPRVYYYRHDSAAARLAPGGIDPAYLDGADFLHLTGITPALSDSCRDYTRWLIDEARARGVRISFDVNYRSKLWPAPAAREFVEDILAHIDILFISDEEAEALWGRADAELIEKLAGCGPGAALLKHRTKGCIWHIDRQTLETPSFRVDVVEPIGAGDAFAAGYLAGCVWKLDTPERVRVAHAMGAYSVMGQGDYEGLPNRDELWRFIEGRRELGR